ncbi:MAG: response regulator [Hahellaceae bacterium]|nr:response regulator [Hahellaceae bacterium]MCP5169621.1 response regulator [Hahellaceae bacterium]
MRKSTILLVEDNPDEEELALVAFKRAGVRLEDIVVARDGQEALDYLFAEGSYSDRDARDVPRVIFLDLNMPKIHGLEVLKRIKSNEKTSMVPTVILTSSDERCDILDGYRSGANSFVRKAYDFNEFFADISALQNYWLSMNVTPYD